MWPFSLFKRKPRTLLDEFNDSMVGLFRSMDRNKLRSLSDEEILETARETMTAFKQAGMQKGEYIPGEVLLKIAACLVMARALTGEDFYREHLQYELAKYMQEGLREDYKQGIIR